MIDCRVGNDPAKDLDALASELAATEVLYVEKDGTHWLRHDCGTCSHGLILGYAVRHGDHPRQRLIAHASLRNMRCSSDCPDTHMIAAGGSD